MARKSTQIEIWKLDQNDQEYNVSGCPKNCNTNLTYIKGYTFVPTVYLFDKIGTGVLAVWRKVLARKLMLIPTDRSKMAQYDWGSRVAKYQFNLDKLLQLCLNVYFLRKKWTRDFTGWRLFWPGNENLHHGEIPNESI